MQFQKPGKQLCWIYNTNCTSTTTGEKTLCYSTRGFGIKKGGWSRGLKEGMMMRVMRKRKRVDDRLRIWRRSFGITRFIATWVYDKNKQHVSCRLPDIYICTYIRPMLFWLFPYLHTKSNETYVYMRGMDVSQIWSTITKTQRPGRRCLENYRKCTICNDLQVW